MPLSGNNPIDPYLLISHTEKLTFNGKVLKHQISDLFQAPEARHLIFQSWTLPASLKQIR